MKKLRLLDAVCASLVASTISFSSQAASIPSGNTTYQLTIRTGTSCFYNGQVNSCAETSSFAQYNDNGLFLPDPVTGDPIGSSIDGDGWAGIIQFTTDATGEHFIIQSFNQDGFEMLPYVSPPNTVAFATDVSEMTGTIDGAGNMILISVSRQAFMIGFQFLGVQDFMLDDSSSIDAPTNDWSPLTTDTSTHDDLSGGTFSLTGTPFSADGNGGFDGILVSAGNYGDAWAIASGTPYVEIWDAHITTVVPIPAAIWLFGSGLLGFVGVAKQKKVRGAYCADVGGVSCRIRNWISMFTKWKLLAVLGTRGNS